MSDGRTAQSWLPHLDGRPQKRGMDSWTVSRKPWKDDELRQLDAIPKKNQIRLCHSGSGLWLCTRVRVRVGVSIFSIIFVIFCVGQWLHRWNNILQYIVTRTRNYCRLQTITRQTRMSRLLHWQAAGPMDFLDQGRTDPCGHNVTFSWSSAVRLVSGETFYSGITTAATVALDFSREIPTLTVWQNDVPCPKATRRSSTSWHVCSGV